ncbi:4-hydroxy-2-oxoglutarate aldolase, mitochondrial isoform X1 [Hydra vulgaris]|uniref:4-hydroxy-2-oxoglutarate aldolase, mitochondrial n=1 Tax=Hydra vulgaris TaxID=6087 RepID=T2MAD8_HYDVU|nr:4-hydroxy-2-oxoglutarate aldolase, mitochondrial [Hydra vulgaris]
MIVFRSLSGISKFLYKPANIQSVRPFVSSLEHVLDLSGVFPPIPTPFTDKEDIDWTSLKENLKKWEQIDFRGYVVQGSNGEYVLLSHKERVDMVSFVRKNTGVDKLIIAGSACEGTRETLELTNKMADVGADVALIATPSFFKNKMNTNAMIQHYTMIANHSSIPILLYNVPSNTGIDFPLDAIFELAKHPNIYGLKDSGGNIANIAHVKQMTKHENFQIIAGSASFLMPAMQIGAVGGICALANVLGKECCDLYSSILAGKFEEARDLQLALIAPNQAVTRKYNVPGLKYAMDMAGFYGGPCRLPLTKLSNAEAKDVEDSFLGFL